MAASKSVTVCCRRN